MKKNRLTNSEHHVKVAQTYITFNYLKRLLNLKHIDIVYIKCDVFDVARGVFSIYTTANSLPTTAVGSQPQIISLTKLEKYDKEVK